MRRAIALFFLAAAAAGEEPAFRYVRSIAAPAGWARLDLPEDVLDACRPGLPDLRILEDGKGEVAYASTVPAARLTYPLTNFESVPRQETTAEVDRGAGPPLAESATFLVEGEEFLKPALLQSSDDRIRWADVARGSLFAASGQRMLTMRFAPNDRRYWRIRLDDRNGDPIRPSALEAGLAPVRPGPERNTPLDVASSVREPGGPSVYALSLPAANLDVGALLLSAGDAAYARTFRVYERLLFRGEIRQRLVASGTLLRAPGTSDPTRIEIGPLSGRLLRIEVDDGDSPPLGALTAQANLRPRSLFFSASGVPLILAYGSATAAAPRYDLAAALGRGAPASFAPARLGSPTDRGASVGALVPPGLGPAVEPAQWSTRRPIGLPSSGSVATCDLAGLPRSGLSDLRIVDAANRQVPYLLEPEARESRQPRRYTSSSDGTKSIAKIDGLDPEDPVDAVELTARAPEYFSREVVIEEDERDARGVYGHRVLGSALWERRPGDRSGPLRVAIARPTQKSLRVVVENKDNAPLALDTAVTVTAVARIDFVFRPGDKLTLLYGNPRAHAPSYDFTMIAPQILAAPAERAALGPPVVAAPQASPNTTWLWAAVVATVLILVLAIARTLRPAA